MDANRFDDFLRSWSERATRRGISRVLTGLALAGPLCALLGRADSDAKKKRKNKKKKKCKGKKKCGKKCIPKANCCTDAECANGGEICANGGCCRPNDHISNTACADSAPCCSGLDCSPYVGGQTICFGRTIGQPCSFDEQCDSGFCNPNLVCA